MKYTKKLPILIFSILLSVIILANCLFYVKLTEPKDIYLTNFHNLSVTDKILLLSENLPSTYISAKLTIDNVTHIFIKNIRKYYELENVTYLWKLTNSWVSKKHIVNPLDEEVGKVFGALKYASIIKADLDGRGTQLKFLLTLQGDQEVIFKPKWYTKDKIVEGPVYGGKDRHTSEIIAFYLSIILKLPYTPFCVERKLNLKDEILPVATKRFLDTTVMVKNRTCVYGKCYYCSKKDAICADQYDTLIGVVIFNIKANFKVIRSPWMRTYKNGKKAHWELDAGYCRAVKNSVTNSRLLEIIDIAIFDFFIQNGDRHHYEMMGDKLVLLDNGKGLGNPNRDFVDILAPLYQCCILRRETWKKLLNLNGRRLSFYLKQMPDVNNFLMQDHLEAIDRRLHIIYAAVEYCKKEATMIFV
ncbi:hypothetical protein WA026_013532 [Henosepilachna vigintioctopunctata]|uniref:FAM20 C-terminal domain-containing protein n=1 Tax=Henosepilachna vigintioctopunctata TaxID=420089 RepID=A0AAW1V7T7_9CUCU